MNINVRLAGSVATTTTGITIGWITPEPHEKAEDLPECVGFNDTGGMFAIFHKDRRVSIAAWADRAERESVEGIARLILGWEDWIK